jgi:hypothetical protein
MDNPVLYKCPVCKRGFTKDDGWDGAIAHIKTHTREGKKAAKALSGTPPQKYNESRVV